MPAGSIVVAAVVAVAHSAAVFAHTLRIAVGMSIVVVGALQRVWRAGCAALGNGSIAVARSRAVGRRARRA